ncbi:exocyst complex component Sec3-domain-containing protein [Cantharellus anzutake]|uniref:exocyst complex component Sec3-domain-containing protein n=1 Tax=Cantharellus anzutake TaxID=1750568 RepID=UPI001905A702|nr:exocyst complex component Sec3-domain-containing protein [Cantharellus anzutake]KAF8330358.1 exocyst complex component Sec3-domain-containing protein [Cantharellus anzutake]
MDATNVRDQIIASLFRKVNADGIIEETYVSHVKIWEEVTPVPNAPAPDPGAMKPRYILIAVSHTGQGLIYKAKRNPSGSFSIGKKWLLADLKAIEVISKRGFSMTIAKTYKWSAEKEDEMINFIISTSHLCSRLYPGKTLAVAGIQVPPRTRSSNDGRATQPHPSTLPAVPVRRPTNEDDGGKAPTPTPGPSSLRRPALQPGSSSDQSLAYAQPTRVGSPGPVSTQASGSRSRTPVSSNLRGSAATSTATLSPPASIIRTKSTADLDTKPPPVPSALKTVSNNGSQPGTTRPSSPSIKPDGTDAFKEQLNITAHHAPARRSSPSPSRRPTKLNDITDASLESPPKATDGGASGSELPEKAMDRLVESLEADGLNGNILPPLDDEYGAEGTMASVEEMIDEFEWNTIHISSDDDSFSASMRGRKRARAAADQIEARLQDELMALEKANTYSFLESDDRILVVMKMIDDAVRVLDDMNGLVSSYKSQLNSVSEDISYIQSRDRGLQVQNQNQNALLNEINQLLQTVHVDRDALVELIHGSLDSDAGIQKLEIAAAELYKAMLAARETDMAATIERLSEYETHNNQFTTRLVGFLTVMFTAQVRSIHLSSNSIYEFSWKEYPTLPSHEKMELYIGRYSGLILYMREMDETKYSKVCATYYSVSSEMHGKEMKALFPPTWICARKPLMKAKKSVRLTLITTNLSRMNTQLKRGNTLIKSPSEPRKDRERGLTVSEAFGRVLGQIIPHIYREQNFIADFLQINDSSITFADYMGLESYFRRQAARAWGLNPATARLAQGALDLIFGFVPDALKQWTDGALAKDNIQIIGIMSNLERFAVDAEERGNAFLQKLLQKQSQRLTAAFNHLVDDQIKAIEQTKLTTKKRKGVAHFIRYFPIFLNKVETQLIGADTLEIRGSVDSAYDQIVQAMFESLQHMAKLDGAESQSAEDKGMLNYHVILIENMHYFVAEISQQELGAVQGFLRRAEAIYDENLSAYVKLVLRRSMGKILDYFEGVERLLTTTAPSEVHNHSNYSKSALKRILKEYTAKDIRRHVEALHKRVEKHFSTAAETSAEAEGQSLASGPVMVGVWKACEEEMIRDTNTFRRLIEQCYKSDGMSLEYTVSDIEQHFAQRRAR